MQKVPKSRLNLMRKTELTGLVKHCYLSMDVGKCSHECWQKSLFGIKSFCKVWQKSRHYFADRRQNMVDLPRTSCISTSSTTNQTQEPRRTRNMRTSCCADKLQTGKQTTVASHTRDRHSHKQTVFLTNKSLLSAVAKSILCLHVKFTKCPKLQFLCLTAKRKRFFVSMSRHQDGSCASLKTWQQDQPKTSPRMETRSYKGSKQNVVFFCLQTLPSSI